MKFPTVSWALYFARSLLCPFFLPLAQGQLLGLLPVGQIGLPADLPDSTAGEAISDISGSGLDEENELLYVSARLGKIYTLKLNESPSNAALLLDLNDLDGNDYLSSRGAGQGLLGITFHPPGSGDRWMYLHYTCLSTGSDGEECCGKGGQMIARYDLESGIKLNLGCLDQPAVNNNGGSLQFGPDGYLYIGSGDGGNFNDGAVGGPYGQNTNTLLGKLLRVNVETLETRTSSEFAAGLYRWTIPPDNPFRDTPGFRPEIWSLGMHNPAKISFDRATGELYAADIGQDTVEEINVEPSSSTGGYNYGWVCCEGTVLTPGTVAKANCGDQFNQCGSEGRGQLFNGTPYLPPVFTYTQSSCNCCSIVGGYVYRGSIYPSLKGKYFFSDACNARLRAIEQQDGMFVESSFENESGVSTLANPSSFGEDNYGNIYVGDSNGNVYLIVDENVTPSPSKFPTSSPTTKSPTISPTETPTNAPTSAPTSTPTPSPTSSPTSFPTSSPTSSPTSPPTSSPTSSPTVLPTLSPTFPPTNTPTMLPSISPKSAPTEAPTKTPKSSPTIGPTGPPTTFPTISPTINPTMLPTLKPTNSPAVSHTSSPIVTPVISPTSSPTISPTSSPALTPTGTPTILPTRTPTSAPLSGDTVCPSTLDQTRVLSDTLTLYFSVVEQPSTSVGGIFCARLVYEGIGWVAFGWRSSSGTANGIAMIGLPDEGTVLKYKLAGVGNVVLLSNPRQTLFDTIVDQTDTTTTVAFGKFLVEPGEPTYSVDGVNNFFYAVGSPPTADINVLQGHGNGNRGDGVLDFTLCPISPCPGGQPCVKPICTSCDSCNENEEACSASPGCDWIPQSFACPTPNGSIRCHNCQDESSCTDAKCNWRGGGCRGNNQAPITTSQCSGTPAKECTLNYGV